MNRLNERFRKKKRKSKIFFDDITPMIDIDMDIMTRRRVLNVGESYPGRFIRTKLCRSFIIFGSVLRAVGGNIWRDSSKKGEYGNIQKCNP